ncbi:MAG: anti-anti-sigma factor, partial [Cytophagaceae bacterium]
MAISITGLFKKNRSALLENWIQKQLSSDMLRDDLITNDELRGQSEELINALVSALTDENITQVDAADFDEVYEILSTISMSRARQGFSPRETSLYIFSLKEVLIDFLQQQLAADYMLLFTESQKINRLFDTLGTISFETFIKGREEVILRQNDEISDISTPVIQIWDGILALPLIGQAQSTVTPAANPLFRDKFTADPAPLV